MSILACFGGSTTSFDFIEQEHHWLTLLHKQIPKLSKLKLENFGINGGTNTEIFTSVLDVLTRNNQISICLISWVYPVRYRLSLGFELYPTIDGFNHTHDVGVNGFTIPRSYLTNIGQRFFALHHIHFEYVKLLTYINIIKRLCDQNNIKVFFVNDSCGWDLGYFDRQVDVLPDQYTDFTQHDILNVNNRSDEEIFKLYQKLHDEYDAAGGIQKDSWLNLYQSLFSLIDDYASDGCHPGPISNKIFVTMLLDRLCQQV